MTEVREGWSADMERKRKGKGEREEREGGDVGGVKEEG